MISQTVAIVIAAMLSAGEGVPNLPLGEAEIYEFQREAYCLAKAIYGEDEALLVTSDYQEVAQRQADIIVAEARKNKRTICAEAESPRRYNGFFRYREERNWLEDRAFYRAAEEAVIKLTWRLDKDMSGGATHFLGPNDPIQSWESNMALVDSIQGWRFLKDVK